MKEIILLILVNLFIVFAWISFDFSKSLRVLLIILQSLFFIFWGLEIHSKENKITKKNIFEYVLIGAIAIALVVFLIYYD